MGILETLLGRQSLNDVRVSNFTECVVESPGLELVDTDNGALTIRIHPETTANADFIRLLNSSRVSIRDLYTDDGSLYLSVSIR